MSSLTLLLVQPQRLAQRVGQHALEPVVRQRAAEQRRARAATSRRPGSACRRRGGRGRRRWRRTRRGRPPSSGVGRRHRGSAATAASSRERDARSRGDEVGSHQEMPRFAGSPRSRPGRRRPPGFRGREPGAAAARRERRPRLDLAGAAEPRGAGGGPRRTNSATEMPASTTPDPDERVEDQAGRPVGDRVDDARDGPQRAGEVGRRRQQCEGHARIPEAIPRRGRRTRSIPPSSGEHQGEGCQVTSSMPPASNRWPPHRDS